MNRLKELREERGLTVKALADVVGCSDSQITLLERTGRRNVGFPFAEKLADSLGVEIHDVFPRERAA